MAKTESLCDYVRRIMSKKGLTFQDVARMSRGAISSSTVSDIINARNANPTVSTLKGLSKGLGVSEHEVFAIARGAESEDLSDDKEMSTLLRKYRDLSKDDREELRTLIELIDREIDRRTK